MIPFWKRAVVVVLMAATLAPVTPIALIPASAPRAEAQWLNFEVGSALEIIKDLLRAAAIAAAKAAIQAITRSLVDWINSGFEGSPAFATNLQRNLSRVADAAVNKLLHDLAGEITVEVDSPFLERAIGTVATGYLLYTSRDAIAERIRSNLSAYSANEEAFRRGQFSEGGFDAWLAGTFGCGNDPFCTETSIQLELGRRINEDVGRRVSELNWGRGFMSWNCNCPPEEGAEPAAEGEGDAQLSYADNSSSCDTCTPGTSIAGRMEFLNNQPDLQLTLAESIDQVLAALASQLVSKIITGSGLFDGGSDGPNTARQGIGQFGGDATTSSILSAGFLQGVENTKGYVVRYQDAWQKILDEANRADAVCRIPFNRNDKTAENLLYIQEAKTRANAGLERATRARAALDDIIERTQAIQRGGEGAGANGSLVTDDYECLQRFGNPATGTCVMGEEPPVMIRPTELTEAITNANDTMDMSPQSMYTKLKKMADDRCR